MMAKTGIRNKRAIEAENLNLSAISDAAGSTSSGVRKRRIRRVASSLLFQTTALAGSFAGLPIPIYSRAYAQTSCSPSVSSYVLDAGGKKQPADTTIPKTTFTCTISSGDTLSTPQYAYGGAYMFYQNAPSQQIYDYFTSEYKTYTRPQTGQPGLNITVNNSAAITVTEAADTALILPPGTSQGDLSMLAGKQQNGISVVSRGSATWYLNDDTAVDSPGGDSGNISITNSGSVSSSVGGGIYAMIRAGDGWAVYDGATAGTVTIVTSGDVTGSTSGVVGLSQGGSSTGRVPGMYFNAKAGAGGDVGITVYDSVSATKSGPAVLGASYGGNSRRSKSTFLKYSAVVSTFEQIFLQPSIGKPFGFFMGGAGGDAGDVTVAVGASGKAFGGTISSVSSGDINSDSVARASGAGIAATSIGGHGVPIYGPGTGTYYYYAGGDGGTVTLSVTATSDAKITTAGEGSPAVIAQSAGGPSNAGYYNTAQGGDGAAVTVTLTGGGTISTAQAYSSGIVAQSLGGAGQSTFDNATAGLAGAGGAVKVNNDFAITTKGDRSHGLVAQSAAASFGYGIYTYDGDGDVVWGDLNDSSTGSQAVTVGNTGAIEVYGTDAHGLVAQSIGGGGGILSSTATLAVDSDGLLSPKGGQQVGGYSGRASGAAVTVTNSGAITTHGGYSGQSSSTSVKLGGGIAILAQSIGGGGGFNSGTGAYGTIGGGSSSSSGSNGSNGGAVTVTNSGALTTSGAEGHGIVAQSIGGGGGTGRNATGLFKAVGGAGGAGGDSGAVQVDNSAAITVGGDYAAGIVAQSIGGGGGQGGQASAWGLFYSNAIGGSGGQGGDGNQAEIVMDAGSAISTKGDHGIGILAQAIGGGGGTGGAAKSSAAGLGIAIAFATGGSGKGGGNANGEARVELSGTVTTAGTDAKGIVVQSIGGGGGSGGASTAKAVSEGVPLNEDDSQTLSLNLTFSHGGSAANGGDGDSARVYIYDGGSVTTSGDGATAVLVQSIGGGGGSGGDATATATSKTLPEIGGSDDDIKNYEIEVGLTLGGSGGNGGNASNAYGHSDGPIVTTGDLADGLVVQSIGGGGGAGGVGKGSTSTEKGATTGTLTMTMGGKGGAGGSGGYVQAGISSTGSIAASGAGSRGIVAQSIGGGGGVGGGADGADGADWDVTLNVGGSGGDGSQSDRVFAWNAGTITTHGDGAEAILAQSIGGGGGAGGLGTSSVVLQKDKDDDDDGGDSGGDSGGGGSSATIASSSDDDSYNFSANLGGGSGGKGGNADNVYIGIAKEGGTLKTGTIKTYGAFSPGVHAHSIGGGGGSAAVTNSSDGSSTTSNTASVSLGTAAGGGGHGGTVTVYASNVYTAGFNSHAIIAQSIGGGGGTGVAAGFAFEKVKLNLGSSDSEGDENNGGAVAVTVESGFTVATKDDNSSGIIAQSIGAGGGIGIVALGTASDENDDSLSAITTIELGSTSHQEDETTLDADTVTIDNNGTIHTEGDRSFGIVAQSIGGGGGFHSASSANIDTVSFVTDQHRAGSGAVTVTLTGGTIETSGDGAVGIIAQSVAGGGGLAADLNGKVYNYYKSSTDYSYDNKTDKRYSAAVTVTVDAKSSIATTGKYAHGIIAQSILGGGGIFEKNGKTYIGSINRDTYGDKSSVVYVTVDGSVSVASDSNAWAVLLQGQDGDSTVTVGSGGTISGPTGSGGGAVYAAIHNNGSVVIDSTGTISGNLDKNVGGQKEPLSAGTANPPAAAGGTEPGTVRFLNQGIGTFVSGQLANVDTIYNAGTIDIGGTGTTLKTVVTGDLIGVGSEGSRYTVADLGMNRRFEAVSYHDRTGTKTWRSATTSQGGFIDNVDVDMEKGVNDQLVVQGDFAGSWAARIDPVSLLPKQRLDLIRVAGNDTSDVTVLPSLVFSFAEQALSDAGWKGFEAKAAFVGTGVPLDRNSLAASRGLQSAWDRLAEGTAQTVSFGGERISMAQAFAAFHDATPETFGPLLQAVIAQTSTAPVAAAPQSAVTAANSVLSCPAFTTGATLEEGECAWGRALGMYTDQDASSVAAGYTEKSFGFQAGGQKALGDGWFLGGSLTYENSDFRNDSGTEKLDAQSFVGALAVKKEIGPWLFAVAAGAGYTWGDSSRHVSLGSLSAIAEAEPKSALFFARARTSYEFTFDEHFYMRPMVDLDIIGVHQGGYTESGAGALNLVVGDNSQLLLGVTPGFELGARVNPTPELPVRLFAGAGLTFLSDDDWESSVRFAGVSSMESFGTYMPINDTVARVTAGIDLQHFKGIEMKLQYDGAFADDYQSHGGSLRFGYRF